MGKADFDWLALEAFEQEERIRRLKLRAEELGGRCDCWESKNAPRDMIEKFWRNVVTFEETEAGIGANRLAPIQFPDGNGLDDQQLHALLWQKIEELAERRIFLDHTDHLSDRELYQRFCDPEFQEMTTKMVEPNGVVHWDLLGGYSEEDIVTLTRFYSEEVDLDLWEPSYPGELPPRPEPPPFPRGDRLPQPPF